VLPNALSINHVNQSIVLPVFQEFNKSINEMEQKKTDCLQQLIWYRIVRIRVKKHSTFHIYHNILTEKVFIAVSLQNFMN